jgi:phage gpG-like protein
MSKPITIDSRPVLELLQELSGKCNDMSELMGGIGSELETRISNRFETRTDPMGVPWLPWAESTLEFYPWDGEPAMGGKPNGLLLDRYGDMLKGLSHQADAMSVTVGFDQPYSAFHEWGTTHMPRRGLIFGDPDQGTLSPDDERSVLDAVTDYLNIF